MKIAMFKPVLVLACFIFSNLLSKSQPFHLQLSQGSLVIESIDSLVKKQSSQELQAVKDLIWIGYFQEKPSHRLFQDIQNAGLNIISKLDTNCFIISSQGFPLEYQLKNLQIIGGAIMPASLKINKILRSHHLPEYCKLGDRIKVSVAFYTFSELPLTALVKQLPPTFVAESEQPFTGIYTLIGSIPSADLENLANIPSVQFVDLPPAPPSLLNENGRALGGAFPAKASLLAGGEGLTGKGIVVGVGDEGSPFMHPDLYDRSIDLTPGNASNHSSHVSGTVAGAGIISPKYMGMAPSATIINTGIAVVLAKNVDYWNAYGMAVTNNSVGLGAFPECSMLGVYGLAGENCDVLALKIPQQTHIVSSGNIGDWQCGPYPQRYGTVFGGGNNAKNLLVVGRTDYDQQPSSTSSNGPTIDGRLKPDLTALGIIASCNGNGNGYYLEYGTSMSTPVVSGAVTLLYEKYRKLFHGEYPNSALVKALILNGTRDIFTPGPDFRTGFGTLMLNRSLRMLNSNHYWEDSLSQDDDKSISVVCPPGQTQLKVMLYWNDLPGTATASKVLVNDLDLVVISPHGGTYNPLVLNGSPSMVSSPAKPGIDRVNNVEQVVIDNPVPGTYTFKVKGYSLLGAVKQAYALAWDYFPPHLQILSPFAGNVVSGTGQAGSNFPITWEDEGNTSGTYSLKYSVDDGLNWIGIVSGLKDSCRAYWWVPPSSAISTKAKIKIEKTSAANPAVSGNFNLFPYVNYSLSPIAEQCEGAIKLKWSGNIPKDSIDGYVILIKRGPAMDTVATVPPNTYEYTIHHLNKDSTYYVSVVMMKDGMLGTYAFAIIRIPNNGNCQGNISNNDLKLDSITSPRNGRRFTSTELKDNQTVTVRVKNMDDITFTDDFIIHLRVNSQTFSSGIISTDIAAQKTYTHEFKNIDFSPLGEYDITASVRPVSVIDPDSFNDTFNVIVKHVENPPLVFTGGVYCQDFSAAIFDTLLVSTFGLPGVQAFDYYSQGKYNLLMAKKRLLNQTGLLFSRSKWPINPVQSRQYLEGTFNLSQIDSLSGLMLELKTIVDGIIWVRGSDTAQWIAAYNFDSLVTYTPRVTLNLDAILTNNNQKPSSSFQVRLPTYEKGAYSSPFAMDSLRIFYPGNDMAVVNLNVDASVVCGYNKLLPVSIIIKNKSNRSIANMQLWYTINGKVVCTDTLKTSITPGQSYIHQFSKLISNNDYPVGVMKIMGGIKTEGDNIPYDNYKELDYYNLNATLEASNILSYIDECENWISNGQTFSNCFACGQNSSWQLGVPKSGLLNKPVIGKEVWKTNLSGSYNHNEHSFLYFPKIVIRNANNPMLSFAFAYDLPAGDSAWLEFSVDNITWKKLGAFGDGTNWYNDATGDSWTASSKSYWHVASIPLPKLADTIGVRLVFKSDDLNAGDGIAIDDIHTYDLEYPIYYESLGSNKIERLITDTTSEAKFSGNKGMNTILYSWKGLGKTEANTYIRQMNPLVDGTSLYGPRVTTIISDSVITDDNSPSVVLFITDDEIEMLRSKNACPNCKTLKDFTELLVAEYSDANLLNIDSTISNNTTGTYILHSGKDLFIVPYDKGYAVMLWPAKGGEYWFCSGELSQQILPANWLYFEANKSLKNTAILEWKTGNEVNVLKYEIEHVDNLNGQFEKIGEVAAKNHSQNNYLFEHAQPDLDGVNFYRIKRIDRDGHTSFSIIRNVKFEKQFSKLSAFPNPTSGILQLNFESKQSGSALISVRNIIGVSFGSQVWNIKPGLNSKLLDLRYGAGTYIIEVNDSYNTQRVMVVKQN